MAAQNGTRHAGCPVNVLIACDHIDFDGALHGGGRQLIELTRGLDRARVEPTVCVLRRESALGAALREEGLPFRFFGDARYNPASLAKFLRTIRERHIDVLHVTDFGASTLGRIAGRLTGLPVIVQVISHHSPLQPRGYPRVAELAYRALAPSTARALAISSSVKEFAVRRMGFRPDDVEVLGYPLPRHSWQEPTQREVREVRQRHGIADADLVVGAVTRFFAAKGIGYLVEGFARVVREVPRARLLLVGAGPDEAKLRASVECLGLGDRVVFAGFRRDAHCYVGTFAVAVVPSLEEGFGLVALEAQALGVPVVASRVGGLPDVVADGKSGLLVEPADSDALATAIVSLLNDDATRARMHHAARRQAQRFSLDAYVERLTTLYHELARPAQRRAS